jgi:Protein of unknown function (DUF2510)
MVGEQPNGEGNDPPEGSTKASSTEAEDAGGKGAEDAASESGMPEQRDTEGNEVAAQTGDVDREDVTASSVEGGLEATEGAEVSAQVASAGWYQNPNVPNQQRYWDGSDWTDQTKDAGSSISTTKRSADERKAILAQQLQLSIAQGFRVESQSEFQVVLVRGKPVNHTLHAILTIFTCLLWGIVWAVVAGTGGEKREMVVVDEFGNVQLQKLGKA